MVIKIEIVESERPYNNGKQYCVTIGINGKYFIQVIPDSSDFKDLMPCVLHSLSKDPDFKFKGEDA